MLLSPIQAYVKYIVSSPTVGEQRWSEDIKLKADYMYGSLIASKVKRKKKRKKKKRRAIIFMRV